VRDVKVDIWCAVSAARITGQFVCVCVRARARDHSFDTHAQIDIILEHVPYYGRIFFYKDSAAAHITCNSLRLQSVFGYSIIRGL